MFLGVFILIIIIGILIAIFKPNDANDSDTFNDTCIENNSVVDLNEVEEPAIIDYNELYKFETMSLDEYLNYEWSKEIVTKELNDDKSAIRTNKASALDDNNNLVRGELSINFYGLKFAFLNISNTVNYTAFNKFEHLNFTVHSNIGTVSTVSIGKDVFSLENSEIKKIEDFSKRYDNFITTMNSKVLCECENIILNLSKNGDITNAIYNLAKKIDKEIIFDELINYTFFTLLAGNNILLQNYLNIFNGELERVTDYCNKDQGLVEFYNKNLQIFFTFCEVLNEKFSVNSDFCLYITYRLLINYLTDSYRILWEKDYKYLFDNNISIEEFVKNCFINNIVYYEESNAMTCLSYYYMYHSKEDIRTYEKAYKKIKSIYDEYLHEKGKESFFNTQQSNSLDNRTIYTISDIDNMSGTEFEYFLCELFTILGYKASVTKASGDQGIDVIAEKDGKVTGIQTKCYSQTVGNSAVQEAVAGKAFYNCDKVMVITNNYFTKSAIELAQKNNVILWNREVLISRIQEADFYKNT